jgi:hypothetical protein
MRRSFMLRIHRRSEERMSSVRRLASILGISLALGCNHPEPVVPPRLIISPGGSATVVAAYRLVSIDERRMPTAHIAGQVPMDSVTLHLFDDGFFSATTWFGTRAQPQLTGSWGTVGVDSLSFGSPGIFGGTGGRIRADSLIVVGFPALGTNPRYAYLRR